MEVNLTALWVAGIFFMVLGVIALRKRCSKSAHELYTGYFEKMSIVFLLVPALATNNAWISLLFGLWCLAVFLLLAWRGPKEKDTD